MFKFLCNKKGVALAIVMMIMAIVMIFVTIILNTSLAEARSASVHERKTQAHYYGRSGVNVGLEKLKSKLPYDLDINQLYSELDAWSSSVSPFLVDADTGGKFTLSYILSNPKEIKIVSEGESRGTKSKVTLRVKMSTSLLNGGRADLWYNGNSATLKQSLNPATGTTYLGQGVFFDGKSHIATRFPSNSGGGTGLSTFQASILQMEKTISGNSKENNVSITFEGQTQDVMFDAEIIVFEGIVCMKDSMNFKLSISETVAKNKINNSPESILYIEDSTVRNEIATNHSNGVGFENIDYHKWFTGEDFMTDTTYPFISNTRYGIVYFGNKLVKTNNGNNVSTAPDMLPTYNAPTYAEGYFYYADNINISDTADLNNNTKLIPVLSGDPIVGKIEMIKKVTLKGDPFIWDKK